MSNQEQSMYDKFHAEAVNDIESYRKRMRDDGTSEYIDDVKAIISFSNKVTGSIMISLFGERLGQHLIDKLFIQCNRDFLKFLSQLYEEYQFFLLHYIRNNYKES